LYFEAVNPLQTLSESAVGNFLRRFYGVFAGVSLKMSRKAAVIVYGSAMRLAIAAAAYDNGTMEIYKLT
jgi:hypothetical protein